MTQRGRPTASSPTPQPDNQSTNPSAKQEPIQPTNQPEEQRSGPTDNQRAPTILLIAPMGGGSSRFNAVGGNKVMADEQTLQFTQRGFKVQTVDTSGAVSNLPRWIIQANRVRRFLRIAWSALLKIRQSDVVFLIMTPYKASYVATYFWLFCQLMNKPFVLRLSGAGLNGFYERFSRPAIWLAERTWMRSSLVYVETEQLRNYFSHWGNFRWFPNTRDLEPLDGPRSGPIKRLIFAGRLEIDKGWIEALEACRDLPEGCHLNVFGPGDTDTDFSLFDGHPRATYHGAVSPAEIFKALREHDLLLFPSYCRAEGYPGAILEAFQSGAPVVAADWGGVAELVEDGTGGIIVEPRSVAQLKDAIWRLLNDPDLYQRLSQGARERGEIFRSSSWYDRVAAELRQLCR